MSDVHHTPHVLGAPLTAAEMNSPLAELDAAIDAGDAFYYEAAVAGIGVEATARANADTAETNARVTAISTEAGARITTDNDLQSQISGLVVSGSGTTTVVNGAGAASGQKVVPVASTTGFTIGDPVFLVNTAGASEAAVIASISAGVSITTVANLTNTYAVASTVSKSPAEVALARGEDPTLAIRLTNLRKRLTTDRTYYVRSDGSDGNTGLVSSAGGAFATIQKAINVIARDIDLNGHNVVISVGNGTTTRTDTTYISGQWTGDGTVSIVENGTGTTVSTAGANCFWIDGAAVIITGFKFQTTGGYACIEAANGARVSLSPREFGACLLSSHIECLGSDCYVAVLSSYTISGSANSHLHGGIISYGAGITVTLTGTPTFTAYFAGLSSSSYQQIKSVTFVGAATGPRFVVHNTATIDCGGAALDYLPGSTPGLTDTGGQYLGNMRNTGAVLQPYGWATPAALGSAGNVNNWDPFGPTNAYEPGFLLRANPTVSGVLLTGLVLPSPIGNRMTWIYNSNATESLTLKHNSTSSTNGNRFLCPNNADVVIPPRGSKLLVYDGVDGLSTGGWLVLG